MNPNIRGLKIKNYKEKIRNLFIDFGEVDVLHSDVVSEDDRKFITTFYFL